jgi:hypothetical protein
LYAGRPNCSACARSSSENVTFRTIFRMMNHSNVAAPFPLLAALRRSLTPTKSLDFYDNRATRLPHTAPDL